MTRNQKEIELTNAEALQLQQELIELGRLRLQILFKAHINKIMRDVNRICKDYEKMRTELVMKYGKQHSETETKVIERDADGNLTEEYKSFQSELMLLLSDTNKLSYGEIIESDLAGVESELNFNIFFKLL